MEISHGCNTGRQLYWQLWWVNLEPSIYRQGKAHIQATKISYQGRYVYDTQIYQNPLHKHLKMSSAKCWLFWFSHNLLRNCTRLKSKVEVDLYHSTYVLGDSLMGGGGIFGPKKGPKTFTLMNRKKVKSNILTAAKTGKEIASFQKKFHQWLCQKLSTWFNFNSSMYK